MTDTVPVSVNVQVLVLLPPLEQAPDQMASRPFEMLSVMAVPVANDADPLVPTLTLMPAGLDVTLSPLLPIAVTVTVPVCGGGGGGGGGGAAAGFTVSTAAWLELLYVAKIDSGVVTLTALVVTVKVALVAPAATITLAGTPAATVFELISVTSAPP